MTKNISISLAQVNPAVGDINANIALIQAAHDEAGRMGGDLLLCPELVVSGYPPEDLVLKPAFQQRIASAVKQLAIKTADNGVAILLGCPWRDGDKLYNAALLLDGGNIVDVRFKHQLPNYGVFDEKRLFTAGPLPEPVDFRGIKLGVMICEDMWTTDVSRHLAKHGADIFVVLNGSPFEAGKTDARIVMAQKHVADCGVPLVYVNMFGGQDELVFDGASFALSVDGDIKAHAPSWEPYMLNTIWHNDNGSWKCDPGHMAKSQEWPEAVYSAMTMGLGDYVTKNGFPGVVIGLSGGIDSALSAAVAVDALGAERVHLVMMPSPYTSDESLEDAWQTAELLGVALDNISIEPAMKAFDHMLASQFKGMDADVSEENIQARSRALVLMAISNKFGSMVLTTGNKSEMSVGYATLYGDMCGGYSVLKDVYKTDVFKLSAWRNHNRPKGAFGPDGPVMTQRVICKPPSAELRANQTDQDTLPPYHILDAILKYLIEEEHSPEEVAAQGFDAKVAHRIWRMLDRAEYKRRQAPPGVKITSRSFGRDRRYPITNRFTNQI